MKVSYNWLQTFFAEALPPPQELEQLLTFHSSEIEEVVSFGGDTVLDVKVLPDKSAWLLSQRGVAKEVSTIIGRPLINDPLATQSIKFPSTDMSLVVATQTPSCDYYSAALVTGVAVGPSPAWLVDRLLAIGQRPINNVVDATNYVMFSLGQPLHAFDAARLGKKEGQYQITVRQAKAEEKIITLTGEEYELQSSDTVIVDATCDTLIGIAGVKGGQAALVDASTTEIIIEAAHFDRFAVRNTAKRLRLQTDAAKRYENGVSVALAPYGLATVVELILDIAEGKLVGVESVGNSEVVRKPVEFSLPKLQSVLGIRLEAAAVVRVLNQFGYLYTEADGYFTVTPPRERDDLHIAEDMIEEIGRIYGLQHIVSIPPQQVLTPTINRRHYYAEQIRETLLRLGWSEIYTSSFRDKDLVQIKNALASDKSYLRSRLQDNIHEAVIKNIPQRDLLGLPAIKVFEIGTVFVPEKEFFHVGLGAQTGNSYKAKVDDRLILEAKQALESLLCGALPWLESSEGIAEFSLDEALASLAEPINYESIAKENTPAYQPFSLYPAMTRDIALWVDETVEASLVLSVINEAAGLLRVRTTLFDEFKKAGQTSYAFRLVFQAKDRTLTDGEVEVEMAAVYGAITKAGFTVR